MAEDGVTEIAAANPVWSDIAHTRIDLILKTPQFPEGVPFTASPDDPEAYGREIYKLAVTGAFGPVGEVGAQP